MARWQFFTNHLHVLVVLATQPDLRLREIASEVGITERATHRIISELADDGYLTRTRVGSRTRYEVTADAPLRHPLNAEQTVGQVIALLSDHRQPREDSAGPTPEPAIPTRPADHQFRDLFASAPAGIVVADAGGRFLAVNPAYCALLGYREDELIGRNFRDITHPDDPSAPEEAAAELTAGTRAEDEREKRYVRRDGTVIWVKFRITAATDPATGQRCLVAHAADITERKRREQAFAESEQRFKSAFDNAPIGLALVAPDGRWLKVNQALCQLTGYPETALLVRTFQDVTHPDDLHTDLTHVRDLLAGRRRTYQMDKRYYHANGHLIWVTLSVSLVTDTAGQPLYFISQIEDITERKHREQAPQDQAAQLVQLNSRHPATDASAADASAGPPSNGRTAHTPGATQSPAG